MYIISGEFKVKPQHKARLIEMSLDLIPQSLKESGCISYGFYEDQNQLGNFLFFERWQSKEAIEQHFQASYFLQFTQEFPDLISGSATIEIHRIAATELVT